MREISVTVVRDVIERLCIEANQHLPKDVKEAICTCRAQEDWEIAKGVLDNIIENYEIADRECVPICQDTGMACVFLEIGQEVHFVDGSLYEAVHEMIQKGAIISAYALDGKGLAAAVSKMAFGNKLGVTINADVTADVLFAPGFGNIVAEVPEDKLAVVKAALAEAGLCGGLRPCLCGGLRRMGSAHGHHDSALHHCNGSVCHPQRTPGPQQLLCYRCLHRCGHSGDPNHSELPGNGRCGAADRCYFPVPQQRRLQHDRRLGIACLH